ncbi:MAG: T9SS type A sorting domain-containing protein [Prevotellaceae bacterium]|jgi:hypothetical protein|nr:T9SS type A sorting domain-containing protein [Prevotellaceae bacterium]
MKKAIYIFLLSALPILSQAQHILTAENNMMRPEDEIVKQQVDYKDPGRAGQNVLWNFGELNLQNEAYRLTYSEDRNGQIRGTEHNTRYYYRLSGDTLLQTGYENPTTLSIDEQPEILMVFPVYYGDSTFGYFNANGRYSERLHISAMGTLCGYADAYGMMILPNGDTMKNVLRIRSVKTFAETMKSLKRGNKQPKTFVSTDSINSRLQNDSVLFEIETFRWYAKGYRYPIFETVNTITKTQDSIQKFFNVAFFYPPQEHYYLEDDPENLAELDSLNSSNDSSSNSNDSSNNSGNADWGIFTYNIHPNPVYNVLSLEYYAEKPSDVIITLYDAQRHLLYNKSINNSSGVYNVTINMGGYVTGSYFLKIYNGHETFDEVIIKY